MSARHLIAVVVVGLLALGGWAVAQQEQPDAKASPEGGPFAVSTAGETAVLLDIGSGKTWVLRHSPEGFPADAVWLPVMRIDSEEAAKEWRVHEEQLKRERAEMERERARAKVLK